MLPTAGQLSLVVVASLASLQLTSASNLRLHIEPKRSETPLPPNVSAELRRVEQAVGSLKVPPVQQSHKVEPLLEASTCNLLAGYVSAELSASCCENTKVLTQRRLASYGLASRCEPHWQCEVDGVTPSREFETKSLSTLCGEPGCLPKVLTAMRKVDVTKVGADNMDGICSTLASLGGKDANPEQVSNILAGRGRVGKGAHSSQNSSRACSDEDRKAGKCGSSGGACFPVDAQVVVQGAGQIPVGSIKSGDNVLVDTDGNLRYEPVWGFLHRIPGPIPYMTVVHEHGVFRASANHLVFIAKERSWTSKLVGKLEIGDVIFAAIENSGTWESRPSAIVKMHQSSTQEGMVAPFTASGTLVVDGVVASNYASSSVKRHLPHSLVHAYFFPLRIYHQLGLARAWHRLWTIEEAAGWDRKSEEMHPYLWIPIYLKLDRLLPSQ
mmetsp:Transcript_5915/g.9608  ORF Transcript_5915/g.9608 Transcript_5915/m.9608 type:complete len:440 (-) Transcript_5915:45-1364(-)